MPGQSFAEAAAGHEMISSVPHPGADFIFVSLNAEIQTRLTIPEVYGTEVPCSEVIMQRAFPYRRNEFADIHMIR